MPGSAREEAERLVAAVLAMASTSSGKGEGLGALGDLVGKVAGATLGHGPGGESGGSGGKWATGSAECCVCPVCRVIAAMRDPSPDAAAKLAIGAGDLAHGVASMMRAVSAIAGERPAPAPKPAPQRTSPGEAWSAATRGSHEADKNNADEAWATATNKDPDTDPWGAASAADAETVRAERRAAAKAAAEAAAEAARRVEQAAAQARAVRERVQEAARTAAKDADVVQNTTPEVAPGDRTPRRFDVWAAATADAGAAEVEQVPNVDHEEHGGAAGDAV